MTRYNFPEEPEEEKCKAISVEDLAEVLRKHDLLRRGEEGGTKAKLAKTDLSGDILKVAWGEAQPLNLSDANLSGCGPASKRARMK